MSQELVYTSAPKGLKPGSKGFCTVAMTAGLSSAWVERLEGLSGYRPAYQLGDARSAQNPVNYSHWRVSLAGKTFSVLSRVAFAGADYSQRSNKLAHHLLLAQDELPPAGPAWVLSQPGLLRTQWTGDPQTFPQGPTLPTGTPSSDCPTWRAVAGADAWARALANAFVSEPAKPVYLLYPPESRDNVLALFNEAIAQLPPRKRWEVTFSTYFTELPLNMTCAWRAVLAGTPAADETMKLASRALLIDIRQTQAVPPPPERLLGQAAVPKAQSELVGVSDRSPARGLGGVSDVDASQVSLHLNPALNVSRDPQKSLRNGASPAELEEPDLSELIGQITVPNSHFGSTPHRGLPVWVAVLLLVIGVCFGGIGGWRAAGFIRGAMVQSSVSAADNQTLREELERTKKDRDTQQTNVDVLKRQLSEAEEDDRRVRAENQKLEADPPNASKSPMVKPEPATVSAALPKTDTPGKADAVNVLNLKAPSPAEVDGLKVLEIQSEIGSEGTVQGFSFLDAKDPTLTQVVSIAIIWPSGSEKLSLDSGGMSMSQLIAQPATSGCLISKSKDVDRVGHLDDSLVSESQGTPVLQIQKKPTELQLTWLSTSAGTNHPAIVQALADSIFVGMDTKQHPIVRFETAPLQQPQSTQDTWTVPIHTPAKLSVRLTSLEKEWTAVEKESTLTLTRPPNDQLRFSIDPGSGSASQESLRLTRANELEVTRATYAYQQLQRVTSDPRSVTALVSGDDRYRDQNITIEVDDAKIAAGNIDRFTKSIDDDNSRIQKIQDDNLLFKTNHKTDELQQEANDDQAKLKAAQDDFAKHAKELMTVYADAKNLLTQNLTFLKVEVDLPNGLALLNAEVNPLRPVGRP